MAKETGPRVITIPPVLEPLVVEASDVSVRTKLYESPYYTLSIAINSQTNEKYYLFQPTKKNDRSSADHFLAFAKLSQRLNCPFLMSIVGLNVKKPYFYLTQYAEKGSLRSILRTQRSLTGAQKTIFAISIANCLLYLHHRSIYVPCLTTDIIYVTGKGTCKVNFTEIDQRGVPSWCAPEMDDSFQSNPKTDVFLYAFVLYEMLTGETPYAGMSPDAIVQAVKDRKRPSLSRFTSVRPLCDLIQKCWMHLPDNRPSIEEVVKTIECTRVLFPESDEKEVTDFIHKLEHHRKRKSAQNSPVKSTTGQNSFRESPPSSPIRNGYAKPYLSVFSDYQSDEFFDAITNVTQILKEEDVLGFYLIVSHHFKPGTPINVQKDTLAAINTTLLTFWSFDAFSQSTLLKLLPYDEEYLVDDVFEVLYTVFTNSPETITPDFTRTLQLITKKNPEKALVLFANYAKQYDSIKNSSHVINVLLDNQKVFYHSTIGNEYISTIFFLCFNSDNFFNKYIYRCRPIFCTFMHSEDTQAAKSAYSAVYTLLDSQFQLPFPQIISDVNDEDLSSSAISILLKLTNFPISHQLVDNLFRLVSSKNEAYLLMLRIADDEIGAQYILANPVWLVNRSMSTVDTLRLFMVLLKHLKLRHQMSLLDELPEFLSILSVSQESQVKICLGTVIKKLSLSRTLLNELSEHGFYKALLASIQMKESDTIKSLLIDVVSMIARFGYVNDLKIFTKPLISYLLESDKVCKSSFAALIYLSFHDECALQIQGTNIKEILKQIPKTVIPDDQRSTLLSNIQL